MAEFVELNIEEMIPELENMERLQILSKAEIKNIIKKRKAFEYKLQRLSKSKDDLLRYIQYETDLLKVIRQKIIDKGIGQRKHSTIEYAIINHINKLFNLAIRRFAADVKIWLSYMKFCKAVRFYSCVSRILDQLLELHGSSKPYLYKLAALWEFEECNSIERARKFIHQGIHVHKDSKLIYTEGFKLELAYAKTKHDQLTGNTGNEESLDPILKGDMAKVIFVSATNKIEDVSFYVKLLCIAEEYKFTAPLQLMIVKYIRDKFPNEEITWDTLARRELGLGGTMKERIEKCIQTYQTGLEKIRTQKMWSLYLDCILELNEDTQALPNFKKNCLKTAFNSAHNAEMLTEKHYLLWMTKVEDVDSAKILQWGTERHKLSIKLWTWRLRYPLVRGDEVTALAVFRDALAVPNLPDQLSLWMMILKYFQMVDSTKAEVLWKEGVNNMVVGAALKGRYVNWLAVSRGILAARRAYETLSVTPPLSLDLHVQMSKLEDSQPKLSLKHARVVYETALTQFGQDNTDVWMWYVRFEEKFGDAKNVPVIYERAVKMLRNDLVDVFISEFNLNKADIYADQSSVTLPMNSGVVEVMETNSLEDSVKQPSSSIVV